MCNRVCVYSAQTLKVGMILTTVFFEMHFEETSSQNYPLMHLCSVQPCMCMHCANLAFTLNNITLKGHLERDTDERGVQRERERKQGLHNRAIERKRKEQARVHSKA